MPDFLSPYTARAQPRDRPYDELALVDHAERMGRARAYSDLGYMAPKAGIGDDEYLTPTLPAVRGKVPSTDPFKAPDYLAMEQTRSHLDQLASMARQQLADFDRGPGAALKWKTDPNATPDEYVAARQERSLYRDPMDAQMHAPNLLTPTIMDGNTQIGGGRVTPEAIQIGRDRRLLLERRQRIEDEANRISAAKDKFDQEVVMPVRSRMLGLDQPSVPQSSPEVPDYLAPTDGPWADKIRAINLSRRQTGEAPLRPGSVGDPNAIWGPLEQPSQPAEQQTDSFETRLGPDEEQSFSSWKAKMAPNDSGYDYDFRGAFKAGLTPDANGHWPDTFKKPNHPTFSSESIYANGRPAGYWDGDTFVPSGQNTPDYLSIPELSAAAPESAWSRIRRGLEPFIGRQIKDPDATRLANEGIIGGMFHAESPWMIPEIPQQDSTLGQIGAGVANPIIGAANSMISSPGGLMTGGIGGGLAGAAKGITAAQAAARGLEGAIEGSQAAAGAARALTGAFAADMTRQSLENLGPTVRTVMDPNAPLQQRIGAGVGEALGIGLGGLAGLHALGGRPAGETGPIAPASGPTPPTAPETPMVIDEAFANELGAGEATDATPQTGDYPGTNLPNERFPSPSQLAGRSQSPEEPVVDASLRAELGMTGETQQPTPPLNIPQPPATIKSATESADVFRGIDRDNLPPPARSAQEAAQPFVEQDWREAAYRDNPLLADPERYASELRQKIGESDEAWNARVRDLGVEAERAARAQALESGQAEEERLRQSPVGADALKDELAAQASDTTRTPAPAEASADVFRDTPEQRALRQFPQGADALRQQLSAESVDPQRRAYIEPAINQPGANYRYTVFRVGDPSIPDPIQVDVFDAQGRNLASSSPEELRALGVDMPDVPEDLPQGQYTLDEMRQRIATPETTPTTEEPVNATNPLTVQEGDGAELSRTAPRADVSENGQQVRAGEGPQTDGGNRAVESAQGQGDAGLHGSGDARNDVASSVDFGGKTYTRNADGKWMTATGEPAPPLADKLLDSRAAAQPRWSDRAISTLESLKINKLGKTYSSTPLAFAWDGAIDTAILGIRAGKAVADVVREAVEKLRTAHPQANEADVQRLSRSIMALHSSRDPSVSAPEPTASVPVYQHIETERSVGAPLESVSRDVMPRAEAQKGAEAARSTFGESGALEKAFAGELPAGHDTVVITDAEKTILDKFNTAKSAPEKQQALADLTNLSLRASKRATDLGRQVKFHDEVNRWTNAGLMDAAINSVASKRARVIGEAGEAAANNAVKAVNEINAKAADKVAASPDLTNGVKLTKQAAEKVGAKLTKGAPDLDKQIKGAMQDLGIKIRSIIKQHYTAGDAAGRSLADKLVSDAGLSGAEADALSAKVQRRFGELTNAAKAAELQRQSKASQNVAAKTIYRRTIADKLIQSSNLGALSSGDQFLNMVAKDLKIPSLTVEQATRLNELADKIQKAPEGFKRNEAIVDALTELKKIEGVGKTDIATAIYYAHILSGPTTQAVNTISTAINTSLDLGLMALTNPGKMGDVLQGAMDGFGEGMRQAGRTLRTGVSDKGLTTKTGGSTEGLREFPTLELVSRDQATNAAVRNYSKALRYVGRLMSASDSVFYETAKAAHDYVAAAKLAEMASDGKMTRQQINQRVRQLLSTSPFDFESARQQAAKEGFTGREAAFRTAEIMRQRRRANLGEQDEAGRQYALRATFNEEPTGVLGLVSKSVADAANKFPPFKLFVPFTRIVANVANASLNYSPVGLARALRGRESSMVSGSEKLAPMERQQLFVKGLVGTTGTVAGIVWALNQGDTKKQPFLTGRGPSDANARNQLRETGWMPYSIKIGDRYYSYLNTPMALPGAIIGNLADKVHYDKLSSKSVSDALASALTTVPETLTNMTFLQGLAQMAQIMKSGPEGESALRQWAQGTVGSVVPNAIQQIDRAFDSTVRDSRSDLGTIAGRIPGVRESLPARLSVRGQPVQNGIMERFTRPSGGDDVAQFIAQNQAWIPGADRPTFGAPGKQRPATDDEYRDYQRISGQQIDAQLRTLLPQLRQMNPSESRAIVDRIASQARRNARVQIELGSRR